MELIGGEAASCRPPGYAVATADKTLKQTFTRVRVTSAPPLTDDP